MDRVIGKLSHNHPAVVLLVNSLGVGGAERHTIALANLLSGRFRVVLAYLKPDESLGALVNRDRLAEVCSLNVRSRVDLRAARVLADLAARHDAHLILCANGFALMYAQIARVISRRAVTVLEVFHTMKLGTWKERLSMVFYWPLFLSAHHLVFVCDGQRKRWRRFGLRAGQVHMIYNGVDLDHFDPMRLAHGAQRWRESFGFRAQDRVVGICAALRPEKAHAVLLHAVAQLQAEGQRWKVLIIGDGPMRQAIEATIVALGLQQDVFITGLLSDVRGPLTACDVVALVSKTEAFSIASLEAMAMAKPMIMSDVGGAREQVVSRQNGFLFPSGDVRALAECLRECSDSRLCEEMGKRARQRVESEFSQQVMAAQYAALLERAIEC